MASILSKVRWFDVCVVIGGVGLIVGLQVLKGRDGAPPENKRDVTVFGEVATVVDRIALNTETEETVTEFEQWRTVPEYFGAFASSPRGAYGWTTRYNSRAAAETGALSFCRKWSEDCVLIAESLPADYVETDGVTMSWGSREYFRSYEGDRNAKAYAASESGIARYVSGQRSRVEAEKIALLNCQKAWDAYREDKPLPAWSCEILRSEGLFDVSPETDGQ